MPVSGDFNHVVMLLMSSVCTVSSSGRCRFGWTSTEWGM